MPQQLLDAEYIGPRSDEASSVVMPEHVWVDVNLGLPSGHVNDTIDGVVCQWAAVSIVDQPLGRDAILKLECTQVIHCFREQRDDAFLVALAADDEVVPILGLELHSISGQVDNLGCPQAVQEQADDGPLSGSLGPREQGVNLMVGRHPDNFVNALRCLHKVEGRGLND